VVGSTRQQGRGVGVERQGFHSRLVGRVCPGARLRVAMEVSGTRCWPIPAQKLAQVNQTSHLVTNTPHLTAAVAVWRCDHATPCYCVVETYCSIHPLTHLASVSAIGRRGSGASSHLERGRAGQAQCPAVRRRPAERASGVCGILRRFGTR
jgi:hypothetical protein